MVPPRKNLAALPSSDGELTFCVMPRMAPPPALAQALHQLQLDIVCMLLKVVVVADAAPARTKLASKRNRSLFTGSILQGFRTRTATGPSGCDLRNICAHVAGDHSVYRLVRKPN